MITYLLLLCIALFHSQASAAPDELELKTCIKGHDVFLITDLHTEDDDHIKQVKLFLEELSDLTEPEVGTWFSILAFPKTTSSYVWKQKKNLQGAQNFVGRNLRDPAVLADMNGSLKQIRNKLRDYKTPRSNALDSVIILTYNRPKLNAAEEEDEEGGEGEEEEEEEKGMNSPSKVTMAKLAEEIQSMAMVYVVAIGPFNSYELSDVASGKEFVKKLKSFDELQGLTKTLLTSGCD